MEKCDRLFGLFQRLRSTKQFEGMGIGLLIARKIIEKHGGEVWAEGTPDSGAVFYSTLPKTSEA